MVGSEVDQKYLGNYAKVVGTHNESLSAALFKVLGLSTILSKKLVRARKQRKLDPTRTTKSLDLYRHIIWMAREGYILLDVYVLPFVLNFIELKVLALKLKASFLHIFVLFDHTYQTKTDFSLPGGPFHQTQPTTPELAEADEHQPVKGQTNSFYNYINIASQAFVTADDYATRLLSGSHPLRLSVKLEYSAFAHDCMKEFSLSRSIARKAVDDAFASMEAMTDESFEDAMDLVSSLGVMARRGGN
ncbi:hypothetical protein TWF569_010470 [Orbilia oligospora]|uniref:14-3-3 domain-containing protein n=2 Tax=Orbilia oligospora TaxID=2813651 RepID=G1X855_ARTOA|nr:hypothetical protein AOL_s00075g54 [Orbilia oligospora ATCC 24927]KAF3082575.1 hypothetical protein TWF102_001137 [Orbilia oligospora]EGX50628.1 hypothetical protein AOL_s00075g54 [Orbilia oligospora ATCC 24927]KAF3095365.1 hypothetical protein TWF103_010333 [Orbilia oligospora]KAF3095981.1 hypothetical protein TWF706_007790 [Orbilia oligospora]KAF3129549.1 hypothetical protein TWF703_008836 [Orbilia oligospora]